MIGFLSIMQDSDGAVSQDLKDVLFIGDREMGKEGLPVTGVFTFSLTPDARYQFWSFTNETISNNVDCMIEDFEMGEDGATEGMEYKVFNGSDYRVTISASAGISLIATSLVVPKNSTAILKLLHNGSKHTYNSKTFSVSYQSAVATTAKRYVLYVGSQDNAGLKSVEIRENTTEVPEFEFLRTGTGVLRCSQFSPKKHFVRFTSHLSNNHAVDLRWNYTDAKFYTTIGGVLSDDAFADGGWIVIEEINEL